MARTLRVVSATNQQTKYGCSSFDIKTTPQSPSSRYYYKIGREEISDTITRVNLEDGWTEYTNKDSIWIDSDITVTFIECISNLLQAYGYCTSLSHRLSKYLDIEKVSETDKPDELLLQVNLREFEYGDEDEDTVVDDLLFTNDYNREDEDDAIIHNYDTIEDGGSNIPPFLQLKYVYKIELRKASETSKRAHDLEIGTVLEDIDDYIDWNTKDKIQIKKVKGYQRDYTIWFYTLDDMNRVLDFTYLEGTLSPTTGHIVPLLFRSIASRTHPGYTLLKLKNVVLEDYNKITLFDPDPIEWDMDDEYNYGDQEDDNIPTDWPEEYYNDKDIELEDIYDFVDEDILDTSTDPIDLNFGDDDTDTVSDESVYNFNTEDGYMSYDDVINFGDDDIDTFKFSNGAYYYDFIYDREPEVYYYIGRKINGYYDFSDEFTLYKGDIIGPLDRGEVITLIQWDGHTYKYGTIHAEVDDGTGEDIYFAVSSYRPNRKFYTLVKVDNELYPGNTYLYKFLEDGEETPEYLQKISVKEGWQNFGNLDYAEIYCEVDKSLICVCEVDPIGQVYRLGTTNVNICLGEITHLDAYVCETNTNGVIKIDATNKNTDYIHNYYYTLEEFTPKRYHEKLDSDIWDVFIPNKSPLNIGPSTKVNIAEATETGLLEAICDLITPYRYNLDNIDISIIGTNAHTSQVEFSINGGGNLYYKVDGDIRAFYQVLDDTWIRMNSYTLVLVPDSKVTIVRVDDLCRVIAKGTIQTPYKYQDLSTITPIIISTSAENNKVVLNIPQASATTQYYYNTSGIQVEYYKQFIDLNKWTRMSIGQFATDSLTECAVTVPPGTSLIIAQTDALYNATGKGSLVTPPVYDNLRTLSLLITATVAQYNKVYISISNGIAGSRYFYKAGSINVGYLDVIDGSWTQVANDSSIVSARNTVNTVVEVNSLNQITAYVKFTTPSAYTGDDTPSPEPTPIPTVVKYTLDKSTLLIEIPDRTVGSYTCTSCSGFTFNDEKTNGYVCKSHSDSSKASKYTVFQDKVTNILESSRKLTKYDIRNSSNTAQKVARHHNDCCYAKYNGTAYIFHATMNDTSDDTFTLLVTTTKGVVHQKIMAHRNGKNKSFSGITYYKTEADGNLLFIINDGSTTYDDGTRRHYGIYRYNGSSFEYTGIRWTMFSVLNDNYTAQGIYYNPETEELYIPFFDSSKSEVRYNHILVYDIKTATAGAYMYCTKHIEITGPSGHNFEIESLDMKGSALYASVNRTNGQADGIFKFTIKKK